METPLIAWILNWQRWFISLFTYCIVPLSKMWSCLSSFGLLPWNDSPKLILRTPRIVTVNLLVHALIKTELPHWLAAVGEEVTPDWRETKELLLGFFLARDLYHWLTVYSSDFIAKHTPPNLMKVNGLTFAPAEFPHFECSPSSSSPKSYHWTESLCLTSLE